MMASSGTPGAPSSPAPRDPSRHPRLPVRTALIVAVYLLTFIILDFASQQFEELRGVVAWYPPAGLIYALLLVFGVRLVPAVTIVYFFGSLFIYRMPQSPYALLLWAVIVSSIYGAAAALLRHRIRFDWHLRTSRDVTRLVVTAALVSALLAVLSVSSSTLSSSLPRSEFFRALFLWWIGEMVGVLTVTPFLLVHVMPWLQRFAEGRRRVTLSGRRLRLRLTPSVVGQAFSLVLMFYWVFGVHVLEEFRPTYLVTLPLIWIALDHGFKGVTTGIVASNFGMTLAMWLFRLDLGLLGQLQLLMIVNCMVGLLVGAVVTERRHAETTLFEREERFRTLIEKAVDLTIELAPDGICRYVSPSVERMLGFTPEEIVGESLVGFIHADDRPAMLDSIAARPQTLPRADRPTELRVRHRNGSFRTIEVFVNALVDDPALDRIVINARDVTERVEAEEEREGLEAQLQQAQKMEAVGRLAGGVAHDFNNMLGVILGHAEMALEVVGPGQPLHADLTEIRRAAERSADLTRQLLAFARRQTVVPRVLNLNETVADMLSMLERLIGEDIDLNWQPGAELWPVKVDASQIDQILANLCVNARDAGARRLTIETGRSTFDEAYCGHHPGSVPGEYARMTVADDGCGMDEETLAHAFEPFFTTKGVGTGTGLGLATVYGIVKQNGGFIDVRSGRGEGTTITVYLPRTTETDQPRTEASTVSTARGHETILLVEDEPALLEMTAIMLEIEGYTVLAAGGPGEAIRLTREYEGEIHLLVTDVVMPEMNGRDLATQLVSMRPHLKRLFMSGYTADVIADHGVLDGGVEFIQKPFSTRELAAKVREVLD